MSSLLDLLAPLGWGSVGAAIGVAAYVWVSSRYVRKMVEIRHHSVEHERSLASIRGANTTHEKLKSLKAKGIHDPDVDLFLAVFDNDVDRLKAALKEGANPNVTDTEVLRRHQLELG